MTRKKYAHNWYLKNKEQQFERMRIWRNENRQKVRDTNKKSREKNKETLKVAKKKYRQENREKFIEWNKKWRENNRDIHIGWSKKNRGKCNAYFSAYKHSKRNATPKWADKEEIKKIYEAADFMTRYTGILHHVDHIYPLKGKTVTGLHTHTNLRVIPAKLNQQKSNKIGYEVYD